MFVGSSCLFENRPLTLFIDCFNQNHKKHFQQCVTESLERCNFLLSLFSEIYIFQTRRLFDSSINNVTLSLTVRARFYTGSTGFYCRQSKSQAQAHADIFVGQTVIYKNDQCKYSENITCQTFKNIGKLFMTLHVLQRMLFSMELVLLLRPQHRFQEIRKTLIVIICNLFAFSKQMHSTAERNTLWKIQVTEATFQKEPLENCLRAISCNNLYAILILIAKITASDEVNKLINKRVCPHGLEGNVKDGSY